MRAAALVVLAACGGGVAGPDGGGAPDGAGGPDAALGPDAGPCGALDPDPGWIAVDLAAHVQWLSGLPDRASAARREEVRDYLIAELGAAGIAAERHLYGMGANVVARLPGSDPGAGWILVGAHFDTVSGSPGANDNATGVAAVLATARLLHDTCRRRGVIVAFFDQEEIGLIGSTYLAQDLFTAGEDIVAVHTVDQVGWDEDGDRTFEIELPTTALLASYEAAAGDLGFAIRQTSTSGTDHTAFRDQGYDAVGVTEEYIGGDTTPHYHLASDTYASMSQYLDFTGDAVRLVSRVIADAAQ